MYFTNFLPRHSDINAMVQAAKKDGITHIYAEVASRDMASMARNR